MFEQKPSGFFSRLFAPSVATLKSRRDVPGLMARLSDPDWKKVSEAAAALGDLGDKQAVDALIGTLRSGTGAAVEAAKALGKLRDTRAVEPLMAALDSRNDALPPAAIDALVDIQDQRAVPALLALLSNPRKKYARPYAAAALGLLGAYQAVDPLVACLSDEDYDVRSGAAFSLAKLYAPGPQKMVNTEAIVQALTSAFSKEENWSAQAAMAQALGTLGDPRAVGPLVQKARTWNLGRALEAGKMMSGGLAKLGASQSQASAFAMRPINALLAVAGALASLGKNSEYIAEMLTPALRGLSYDAETAILAQIRKQVETAVVLAPPSAAATAPTCGRCGKALELEPLDPSDALQARLPRTYLGTVCDVCSKVECYRCRGGVGRPCSWCNGHASPAYVVKFAKSA